MNQADFSVSDLKTARPQAAPPRGPFRLLLDLFSSVWLGVFLLALLFIYSSVGSAGAPTHFKILNPANWEAVRQLSWFEMTEFEWFHWWPFDLLIALICTNLITATLRRIPFNVINLGVWMIHSGIIILALGSVWYFSTKVEGDAPVNRRRIVAMAPGMAEPASMVALPGNSMVIGEGDSAYLLQVSDIDPQWELLSGDEKGTKAYKISVRVQSRGGTFIRDLIAGRPQYTQDIIRNPDAKPGAPPMVRAVNALGKPLVDEALQLTLDYDPQQHFYLMDSRAVYLREVGQKQWVQRPIRDRLPRYNDYIASLDDVWASDEPLWPNPLDVAVPAVSPDDPLPDVTFHVSRFLRYAQLETRRRPGVAGDATLDPTVNVRVLSSTGQSQQHQLIARDPKTSTALGGRLMFTWLDSESQREQLKLRIDPVIRFSVPGADMVVDEPITKTIASDHDLPFKDIPGTQYSYRVENFQDNLHIGDKQMSVAIVQIKKPDGSTFKRWVFDNPQSNRDMAMSEGLAQHGADIPLDTNLESLYKPGIVPPAPIMVLAGPGESDLAVMVTMAEGQPVYQTITVGEPVSISGGVSLVVDKYAARTVTETKPFVVPHRQHDRELQKFMSMIKLDVPSRDGVISAWLPYHQYPFASPEEVLRRFPYRPQALTLRDGRTIEFMFSRERMALPASVVLDDFQVASHIGGFTGQTSSIMDWTSMIRFADDGALGDPKQVSVNKPVEHNGFWFFQAQWDPPDRSRFEGDPPSRGLNYTVLGVGNRNGVNVQLAGCCIAVLGMIYTFYVRPVIKRRRQNAVYAHVKKAQAHADRPQLEPVGALKVES